MKAIRIRDGKVMEVTVPKIIELPEHKEKPFPHSVIRTYKPGDADYADGVERYLFFEGYVQES